MKPMQLTSPNIRAIQRALTICTYDPGPIDGILGRRTEGAWKEWMEEETDLQPLVIEGIAGPKLNAMAQKLQSAMAQRLKVLSATYTGPNTLLKHIHTFAPLFNLPTHGHMAYLMATAEWETARTFLPVREGYWKFGGKPQEDTTTSAFQRREAWRQDTMRYYPYYGRGLVQLTWLRNYEYYAELFLIDVETMRERALNPGYALFVMMHGMSMGVFGRTVNRYIRPGKYDFVGARRSVNGTDKAEKIAKLARKWLRK